MDAYSSGAALKLALHGDGCVGDDAEHDVRRLLSQLPVHGVVTERTSMINTLANLEREMDAKTTPPLSVARLRELCEMGTRILHTHNSRKRALEGERVRPVKPAGYSAAPQRNSNADTAATRVAVAAWQEANMSACAGETLLSRVMGDARTAPGSPCTPGLIVEVVEMRARASDLLDDALMLLRQGVRLRS
jgi:hypothetical protein